MNYWKRYIKFTMGTKSFSRPLALEFTNSFNMKGSSVTVAKIYNPSDETVFAAEPIGKFNMPIVIEAGYEDDHGICVAGEIYDRDIITNGSERVLVMKISEFAQDLAKKKVCKTWPAGVTASAVVAELISILGLPPLNVLVGREKVYPRGISFNKNLKEALDLMARETDSDYFLRNGVVFFYPKSFPGIPTGVVLSPATGLLGKPHPVTGNKKGGTETSISVKSLFNYKIGAGELIRIESESYRGNCKVMSGNHSFGEAQAFTEMKVVQV